MDHDPALRTYVAESRELLQEMEDVLLRLEQEADQTEGLNAVFRAAHTIKGSAGLFGLDDIVSFTHVAESLLDMMREGAVTVSGEIIALLLAVRDHISLLIDKVENGDGALSEELGAQGRDLVEQLKKYGAKGNASSSAVVALPAELIVEREGGEYVSSDNWHISLRFGIDSLRDGMDPMSFLRYLGTLGKIANIIVLDDNLPEADGMDPEACYLGFEINFQSESDKQTIESVFDFIREDSQIRILAPHSLIDEYVALIMSLPEET